MIAKIVTAVILFVAVSPAQNKVERYGSNALAGQTFSHDGVRLYYETYGAGEPVLLIHGNGGSIADLSAQIRYFRQHYRVIAMDSRDQGRSANSNESITYEKMAGDLAALLDHVQAGPAYVFGWSDGGIEAILLAQQYPAKVRKFAALGANLNPEGIAPEALEFVHRMLRDLPANAGRRRKVAEMMLQEPHIDPKSLETIKAPVLILAGDHDAVPDEHTLTIYHHLENSELCILPHATHAILYDEAARFNSTLDQFFREPFVKIDRVKDFLHSYRRMKAEEQ